MYVVSGVPCCVGSATCPAIVGGWQPKKQSHLRLFTGLGFSCIYIHDEPLAESELYGVTT